MKSQGLTPSLFVKVGFHYPILKSSSVSNQFGSWEPGTIQKSTFIFSVWGSRMYTSHLHPCLVLTLLPQFLFCWPSSLLWPYRPKGLWGPEELGSWGWGEAYSVLKPAAILCFWVHWHSDPKTILKALGNNTTFMSWHLWSYKVEDQSDNLSLCWVPPDLQKASFLLYPPMVRRQQFFHVTPYEWQQTDRHITHLQREMCYTSSLLEWKKGKGMVHHTGGSDE